MKVTCQQCKRRLTIKRGKNIICKCGNKLNYMQFFRKKIPYIVYLIDANILIYAYGKDKRAKSCKKVVEFDSSSIKIGTTNIILNEVKKNKNIEVHKTTKIYKINKISDDLKYLKTNYLKQPSKADLSLVQAALNHAEIHGIITYDRDFGRIATQGLIQHKSSTKFWLGNAKQFLEKYEIKSRIRPA